VQRLQVLPEGEVKRSFFRRALSHRNRYAQECGRNGSGILVRAFVFTIEQLFQFLLQVTSQAVLFRGFKCTHGWPIIGPEFPHEGRGRAGIIEGKRILRKRNITGGNPCHGKSFDHVVFDPPGHRADEARRRGRRVGRTDF